MSIVYVDEAFNKNMFAGASCAFGVFDGYHEGHRFLVDCAKSTSEKGARSIVITFDIDPDEVFHPQRLKKLSRNFDRLAALDASGVDDVVVMPFVPALYSLGAIDFLNETFSSGVPAHMHVGEDFRFGARAQGTVDTLRDWGAAFGCKVHAHALLSADGKPITSTRIRKLLLDCNIVDANRLLGHPYRLREEVHAGRGEGAALGFATANLQVKSQDWVLGEGVYAARAQVGQKRFPAAVSVGVSPTFEERSTANMEAHILNFEGDLHGKEIVLEFVEHLRPMRKFDSTEELIATVKADIQWVRDHL